MDLSYFKGKKIFVTGNTGFKGSWLSYWLLNLDAEVSGYALKPEKIPSMFNILNLHDYINTTYGDIRDYDKLKKAMDDSQAEIVFHLAAQPLVRKSYAYPLLTFETNTIGTVNLLQCIRESQSIKVAVVITTDKVYENKNWEYGYREIDELGGYDPYSCSKACAELVTKSYVKSFLKDRIIKTARAGNVIGGGDWSDDRLLPDCVRAVINGEKIIIRNPQYIRPWQHVLEPLYGYLLLGSGLGDDLSYNFGPDDDNFISVEKVVRIFQQKWRKMECEISQNKEVHEDKLLKLDNTRAKQSLGWRPVWNIDTAIEKTAEWYELYYGGQKMDRITEEQIQSYVKSIR